MTLSELLLREPDAATLQLWLSQIPYAVHLGMHAEVHGNEIVFILPRNSSLIGNPTLPAVHGGAVGAFMEQAAVFHLISKMVNPVIPKVINFSLDYLRPTRLRDTYASCVVTRQGKQVANVGIRAWQEQRDEPNATARAHFLLADESV